MFEMMLKLIIILFIVFFRRGRRGFGYDDGKPEQKEKGMENIFSIIFMFLLL